MRKQGMFALFFITIFLTLLILCVWNVQSSKVEPIIIGCPTSLFTPEGRDNVNSLKLAAEEINARGGIKVGKVKRPVKIVVADTRDGEPGVPVNDALMAYEKMILREKPHAIIVGAFRSEVLMGIMDLVAKYKIIHLGGIAQTPLFNERFKQDPEKYKYMFRITTNSKIVGSYTGKAFELIRKEYGLSRIFLVAQDTLWARAVSDGVKKICQASGWTVVGQVFYPLGTNDFSPALIQARNGKAEVIHFVYDAPEAPIFFKQFKAMKIPALLYSDIAPTGIPKAWKVYGEDLNYVMGLEFPAGITLPIKKLPKSVHFTDAYLKKFGEPETARVIGSGYDGLYIFANAVERAGTLDPGKLVKAIEETDMDGISGRIRISKEDHNLIFDEDPRRGYICNVFQWQNGKRVPVYPPVIAEGKILLPSWMKK